MIDDAISKSNRISLSLFRISAVQVSKTIGFYNETPQIFRPKFIHNSAILKCIVANYYNLQCFSRIIFRTRQGCSNIEY